MAEYCVLYNPKAGNGKGTDNALTLSKILLNDELHYIDITGIEDLPAFIDALDPNERIIVAGGDGTLNRFVNAMNREEFSRDIYYFAVGSGNDFQHDLGIKKNSPPILINNYIKNLPTVYVNGTSTKFLNGVGYGIDGYCCEEADKIRKKNPGKKINYTLIALKGLLGGFKPANAVVTVDGVTDSYSKVWMVPTMNGRYFGGGFMATPEQDRLDPEHRVSVGAMGGIGILRALTIFPKVYTGKHVKYAKYIHIFKGHDIAVKFDRPTALQIDGETVLNVSEYRVVSKVPANII